MRDNTEDWRPIPGYPAYAVSSAGQIKRIAPDKRGLCVGTIMKQHQLKSGYWLCGLTGPAGRRTMLVHRLVCAAFHGAAPTDKHQAAHNDGDRSNNRADNLRWATAKENEGDKRAHGTVRSGVRHHSAIKPACMARGSRVGTSKLTEEDVARIRSDGRTHAAIAASYGLCRTHVSEIRSRKVWRHVP